MATEIITKSGSIYVVTEALTSIRQLMATNQNDPFYQLELTEVVPSRRVWIVANQIESLTTT
jgi:hypothetical protein